MSHAIQNRNNSGPAVLQKENRYLFSPLSLWWYRRKNGLKRDQFNTLPVDRKERCATYSVAPFCTCKFLNTAVADENPALSLSSSSP
ncbi:hypothetical protein BFW94_23255 [Enterobacter ludwigii]|nr:hypothetical protein AM410_07765 [Enterobacter cloacae complex sp. FDA-CDC-AR_0164]OPB19389.1 hypothetical protein BFW94_23255 [Enterobacter ludwigii]RBO19311.1 hypothetical protein C2E44_22210 [Enterobacter ludwigii]